MFSDGLQILQQLAVGVGYAVCQSDLLILLDLDLKGEFKEGLNLHALIHELILESPLHKGDITDSLLRPSPADTREQERM
jgi:hypothetical protein